jgi:hypothetical protein
VYYDDKKVDRSWRYTVELEQAWRTKLFRLVEYHLGPKTRKEIEESLKQTGSGDCLLADAEWTSGVINKLEEFTDAATVRDILTRCACRLSSGSLKDIRAEYEKKGDLKAAWTLLRHRFYLFLKNKLELDKKTIDFILESGWGLAGLLQDGAIIATKNPKSGNLKAFFNENDPEKSHYLYCHCNRIREVLNPENKNMAADIPADYCYCGGGFYRNIWEEILQRPVQVEVLQSVLNGDDVCSFKIVLPALRKPAL